MKVLVVGGGGREHTLVWKIAQSPRVKKIFCAPGNGGIAELATCVPIGAEDIKELVDFAKKNKIDLTVVGPEGPLSMGIVDIFNQAGLKVFGATQKAAEIESSKSFAKNLLNKYKIPTAKGRSFTNYKQAEKYLSRMDVPVVVKADGLAAGKGVIVCSTLKKAIKALKDIMIKRSFGDAGNKVVIEECLVGEEASFLAFTDGRTVLPLPTSQDHKAIFDNDQGPNTGGMGAYSPAPVVDTYMHKKIMDEVMVPTVRAMSAEGRPYRGVLYAGLMIAKGQAKVLEFNARFGDPEAQPLLIRMKNDIIPVMEAIIAERLDACRLDEKKDAHQVAVRLQGFPDHVQYEFEDNGIGMDQETREKAFSLFFSSKGTEGTGLGLFISDRIARSHGGSIELESEPGVGTRFVVRLPRKRPSPQESQDPAPPELETFHG